ncbi:MAG: acetoacetate decarboxylase, partial [Frankiales bacterium]|nr:acetoacetate decarboxylase [Frankiales bacterium]
VHGGKGIWGMPKHQANLDFLVTPTTVSSQYDVDGLLACRIAIARPRPQALPVRMSSTNYCAFRGMLMKSSISVTGLADVAFGASAQAQLLLGEAPQVAGLKTLGLSARPLFTAYLPSTSGVLDDHVESWFLSGEHEAPAGGDDLRSVTGLGLSQDWLDAPRTLGVPTGWAP